MAINKCLTLGESTGYLKLNSGILYRMVRDGDTSASRIGAQWCFNRQKIDARVTAKGPVVLPLKGTKAVTMSNFR
ncbi:MAG: DNA-binding protein [Caldithrix sp.]|nr:MAG: DNA-binding protein [Caldithrix sp.]